MKMKRMVAYLLALLLVVSLLPMTAMAMMESNPEDKTVEEIPTGDLMPSNGGTVKNNNGYVTTNWGNGTIINNGTAGGGPESGKVSTNSAKIVNNYGEVNNNHGTINHNQSGGLVVTNSGSGTVETNAENATIKSNVGTVGKKDENGNVVEGSGNSGTIKENYGTVITNNDGGTVETNTNRGTIEVNNGLVGVKDDNGDPAVKAGTGNSGTVNTNNGTITTNDGTVNTNGETGKILVNKGTVGIKEEDGSVVDDSGNSGTIETNEGEIFANNKTGTIGTNDGLVGFSCGEITTNNDTVSANSPDGTVGTNNGTVNENYGKVEINAINGIVYNKPADDQGGNTITGKVNTNYGTVYEYDAETESYVTTYGVQVQNTDGGTGTKLIQAVEDTIVKLADLFKRDGYELVGYDNLTPESDYPVELMADGLDDPSAPELSDTEFQAKRPSILSLIWKAIVKPASSGEPEVKTAKTASVLTSLSADQVKVGTYVRCGNVIFKIIEVNDDSIRVATVGKLSEQELADMLGFLKQHLSAGQIAKMIGEPELLEQELVAKYFGDHIEHIAFRAEKDLFEE